MGHVRGLAWDHRRCWGPLDASTAAFEAATGHTASWERRSLHSFGEGDLAALSADHDLIVFDHPFVGEAAQAGYLLDLAPRLSRETAARLRQDAIGATWECYEAAGGLWGLPLDAAAQTAVWRSDLMDAPPPDTVDAALSLAPRLAAADKHLALAAKPTDLFCTHLSLLASLGAPAGTAPDRFAERAAARDAFDLLSALCRAVPAQMRGWNPIRCQDEMAERDDLAYCPFAFNYVNYAAPEPASNRRALTYGLAPAAGEGGERIGLLGGAGLGISSRSEDPEAALAYALFLVDPAYQSGPYVEHGGQPASRMAWSNPEADRITGGFLYATREAMESAWLRPTRAGFLPLFREATERIDAALYDGAPREDFLDWLDATWSRLAEAGG